MRRDDVIMTVALCASLLVHGLITFALLAQSARAAAHLRLSATSSDAIAIPIPDPDDAFGADRGRGRSPNAFDSKDIFKGKQAPQPQAFLSRDPIAFGQIDQDPTMNVLPPGKTAALRTRSDDASHELVTANALPPDPTPFGTSTSLADLTEPFKVRNKPVDPPAPPAPKHAAAGGPPASPAPSADAAPMTDSESDAFADLGSVDISPGQVDPRFGRKVKTVRPKLSIASQIDLAATLYPTMKLRVRLDEAGKVSYVDIVKSSGSVSADEEVKVAVYQWQFEPRKATSRSAGPDRVQFEIDWR